jgi:anti-sigma-K factor RskA
MSAHDHTRYQEDVGAYVLGALTELEGQAFEHHLAGCEACQQELEHLRVAAEALPRSVEQYRAPESLKASLMATVRAEAADAEPRRERAAPARSWPALPRLRPRLAWAAAATVLVIALVAVGFYQLGEGADDAERTITAQVDESRAPDAGGRLVVQDDESTGAILEVSGVPRPSGGRILHVWLKRGNQVVPSSMFQVRDDGSGYAAIPEDLSDVDLVMVTREPGPAIAPSEDPFLTVRVRS